MSDGDEGSQPLVSKRAVEAVVALLFIALAVVVMSDSWRIGARWGSDGPQAGYFPFYIGIIMLVAGAANLALGLFAKSREAFVERGQAAQVLQVLLPTVGFVALIPFLGLYVAAALFIAYFMRRLGRYGLLPILATALPVPLVLFLMFEVWFLVPLPKGPLEDALGY